MRLFHEWLSRKTGLEEDQLARSTEATFSTEHGRILWDHLMSKYYFSVCASNDAQSLAEHNGARALLHELVAMRDAIQNQNRGV